MGCYPNLFYILLHIIRFLNWHHIQYWIHSHRNHIKIRQYNIYSSQDISDIHFQYFWSRLYIHMYYNHLIKEEYFLKYYYS